MTRRLFGRMLVAAGLVCVAGAHWFSSRASPARVIRALKPDTFPGRLREPDEAAMRTEGKWKG